MDIRGFYINRDSGLFCSDGSWERPSGTATALDWLLQHQADTNMLSDLDSDVAALLGMIEATRATLDTLNKEETAKIGAYTLKYFQNRFFAVEKDTGVRTRFANFADASRYKYGLRTVENNKTRQYGEKRAKEAKEVGDRVWLCLGKAGMHATSLVSPASVYRKHFYDTEIIELPSLDKIPDKAMVIAEECCKGNWVQTFRRGHWNKAYDYDINSAYPAQAMKLLDLDKGEWKDSPQYQERATYGYCRCLANIEAPLSPIVMKMGRELFTPRGKFPTSLTKGEIDYISRWKLGEVEILDGIWWFKGPFGGSTPLDDAIDTLYRAKEKAEGIERETIKQLMAGAFYGLFIEENHGELGEYYCSPWAAEIETGTRLQVAEPIMAGARPIAVAVDGLVTENTMAATMATMGTGIGGWRASHMGRCLSIGTGLVAMEHKDGEGDFSLTYSRATQIIRAAPRRDEWEMEKMGTVKLARACQEKRWHDIGKVETMIRTFDLTEGKMDYDSYPENGEELLSNKYVGSMWSAGMLMALD